MREYFKRLLRTFLMQFIFAGILFAVVFSFSCADSAVCNRIYDEIRRAIALDIGNLNKGSKDFACPQDALDVL